MEVMRNLLKTSFFNFATLLNVTGLCHQEGNRLEGCAGQLGTALECELRHVGHVDLCQGIAKLTPYPSPYDQTDALFRLTRVTMSKGSSPREFQCEITSGRAGRRPLSKEAQPCSVEEGRPHRVLVGPSVAGNRVRLTVLLQQAERRAWLMSCDTACHKHFELDLMPISEELFQVLGPRPLSRRLGRIRSRNKISKCSSPLGYWAQDRMG